MKRSVALFALLLAACSFVDKHDPKSGWSADKLYRDAKEALDGGQYDLAIKRYETLARMKYLVNALASHEVHVARYYMKRGAYVAAANRAQYALKNYPQAPAQEDALLIMIRAYDVLGMPELRDDAERILRKNFPDSVQPKSLLTQLGR